MLRRILSALPLALAAISFALQAPPPKPTPTPLMVPVTASPISVWFSPNGGCRAAVIAGIDAAKTSVFVRAYGFTSEPVADALIRAHKRGVAVRVMLDKSNRTDKHSQANRCDLAGILTIIDGAHHIAHNKIVVVDDTDVFTGSWNLTENAEHSNAENLVRITDPALARQYLENHGVHALHCKPW